MATSPARVPALLEAPAGPAVAPAAGAASPLDGGGRARLLSLLFGMNLINYVDRVNITIVAPVILADLGWVNTIPTLGGMGALIGGGWLSDRLVQRGVAEGRARKLLAVSGLGGLALCMTAAALAPSGVLAVTFFTLNGFVQGFAVAPLLSLPAVLAPSAAATIAAAANFCMALGGVVSPWAAGPLRDRTADWSVPFVTAAVSVSLALALASLVLGLAFRAEALPGHEQRGVV